MNGATDLLSNIDVMKVVNGYIGVEGGYLIGFSYNSHEEFYPMYCGLDIDPKQHKGTTRQRFISILSSADAPTQAKILRSVLIYCAVDNEYYAEQRQKPIERTGSDSFYQHSTVGVTKYINKKETPVPRD
ncbi:hypothetical protein [Paenibacillus sp. UNC496MF]|uniref:hypothetical protein n=1 Tax=Paenibacillus sp. UNC496MF TaxID=1502753 RepID=UPI001C4339DC|nr:hypothetical protein [Paenibacillus sp. UNC496MF]